MNAKLVLVSALAAAGMATAGVAQTATPEPSAPAASAPATAVPALPTPLAVPARIAIIELEDVALATNEGQKAAADIQKQYEPEKAKLDQQKAEIDSLTKQLQSAPATMGDEEKASRARVIDTKQKQLQRDVDDTQTQYASDMQVAVGKIEQKMGPVIVKYVQQNGYSMLLDNEGQPQQGGLNLLWAPGTDISGEVVKAYNTSSGVAAPPPPAPSANRPHPAAPKPAAPKQ